MTTITYREGTMAADSSMWDAPTRVGSTNKIWKNAGGRLGGAAGCFADLARFRDWFLKGCAPWDVVEMKDEESEAMIISPDGSVQWLGSDGRLVVIEADIEL